MVLALFLEEVLFVSFKVPMQVHASQLKTLIAELLTLSGTLGNSYDRTSGAFLSEPSSPT